MSQAEREAFPEQWHPTRFSRELEKPNTVYLVAVRPWTPEELARFDTERGAEGAPSLASRVLAGLNGVARSVGLGMLGEDRRSVSPEYVAGFAGAWFVADEAHVVTIGARERERRRGIADLLLMGIADAAVRLGSRHTTLEVRRSNAAALALYRKHGFREMGVRKRYYSDNGEDAVIMTTPPIQSEAFARMQAALARDHVVRLPA